jgi:hypothetical protein
LDDAGERNEIITRKYKAYCIVDASDDPAKLPSLHSTRKQAIESNESFTGNEWDDPLVDGVLAEVLVFVKLPRKPKCTEQTVDRAIFYANTGPGAMLASSDPVSLVINKFMILQHQKESNQVRARLLKALNKK